jgi:hypothetical protein
MAMIDLFKADGFNTRTLTDAIQVVPNTYGKTSELGLFADKFIPTTGFNIEYSNGVLNLLPTSQRGGNGGTTGVTRKRQLRTYSVVHIEHDEYIYADDVQNIRAFGEEYLLKGIADTVAEKLEEASNKHDITTENLNMSALRGQIADADGTVLLNLFTEFGITEQNTSFVFTNANTDISATIVSITRYMELNLLGETMTGVHCLCSPEFFDSLTGHASIKAAYQYYASTQEPLRNDMRRMFTHKGITFEEYLGRATYLNTDNSQTTTRFIPATEARFIPLGTRQTFRNYYGPADFVGAVNRPGLKRYVKVVPDPTGLDKFVRIHTQQNPMPFVTRPQLLVRGTSA